MSMRKWQTNKPELQAQIGNQDEVDHEGSLSIALSDPANENNDNDFLKVLGIKRDPQSDTYSFDPSGILQAGRMLGDGITKKTDPI